MEMEFINKFNHNNTLEVKEGDRVEVIVRSSLYCINDESPISHSGILQEIRYEEFSDGTFPVDVLIKFDKDSLYEDGEEDYISLSEIEDIFVKKYEIFGYGMLNEGVTLSIKGEGVNKIIWYTYKNGSLIPEYSSNGSISTKHPITEEDTEIIREIRKYGSAQRFTHFVLSQSDVLKKYNLTDEQVKLFKEVYSKHQQVMGTETRKKYTLSHIDNIVWDHQEDCLKVYYSNGDWWHYTKEGTWY